MNIFRTFFILLCAVVVGMFAPGFLHTAFAAEGDLVWTQTSNPSAYSDYARSVTSDGTGIYVVGDAGRVNVDQWWIIEKRNLSNGAIIWTQTSNPYSFTDIPFGVAVDSSGVYIVGSNYIGSQNTQWRIEKRSLSDGNLIWAQTSNPSSGYDYARAVAVDSTGVYIVGYDQTPGNYQWRIEKRNLSNGAIIWTQTSNTNTLSDIAYAVAVDGSGVYITGFDNSALYNPRWRTEKRNLSTGSLIWAQAKNQNTGGASNPNMPYAITVDSTGVYVAGYTDYATGASDDGDSSWSRMRIEKRNLSTGAIIWEHSHNPTVLEDVFYGIDVDNSGIYLAGTIDTSGGYSGNYQWYIEKRNLSTGSVLWTKTNSLSAGVYGYANSVAVSSSGIYVAGFDFSPGNAQWRIEKREITPPICTGPFAVSWTDSTITANTTKIRKVHIDELRTQINTRRVDAGLTNYAWTDPTITANTTKIRKVHIDELRSSISQVYTACGQAAPSWTDSTITANSTKIRKMHIDELRSAVGNAK